MLAKKDLISYLNSNYVHISLAPSQNTGTNFNISIFELSYLPNNRQDFT